jgi:hypothetical protein
MKVHIADELRARANDLRTGRRTWVQTTPTAPDTQCLVLDSNHRRCTTPRQMLSDEAIAAFEAWLPGYLRENYPSIPYSHPSFDDSWPQLTSMQFNDTVARNKEEVIKALETCAADL